MKLLLKCIVSLMVVGLFACTPKASDNTECPTNPFPDELKLPQIYIQGKLYWTVGDLESLQTNIIDPIIAYFETEEQHVVSIMVTTDDLMASSIETILVDVIIDQLDGNSEAGYMGMLIEKVDGVFPLWEPESMGP
jgi:hypothetical protein